MKKEQQHRLIEYKKILKKAPVPYRTAEKLYEEAESKETGSVYKGNVQKAVTLFVAAPVLCRFVWWVLLTAERKKIRRLYFITRDGYFPYQIAQIFCKAAGFSVECRYLHCSRYALRSAEYHLLGKESLSYLCLGGIDVTFEKVMYRAGLNEKEKSEIEELLGYKERKDVPLSYTELSALKGKLSVCKPFLEKLFAHAKENYPAAICYLRQEGLFDLIPYAIVDSGWMGSMQKSLSLLLFNAGFSGKVKGFYFGMYGWPKEADLSAYHTYYFAPSGNLQRKARFACNLFECMLSAPTGMTKGYMYSDGKVIPVLERRQNPNAARLKETEKYLLCYAQELAQQIKKEEKMRPFGTLNITKRLLDRFMGYPTKEEAAEYGSYIFCDDVIGEDRQTLAAELSVREMKESHLMHRLLSRFSKRKHPTALSAWQEGSAVLAEAGKKELWHCACFKYARAVKQSMEAQLVWKEWKKNERDSKKRRKTGEEGKTTGRKKA